MSGRRVSLTALLIVGCLSLETAAGETSSAGQVEFTTSCDAAVRSDFNRAVALLYSFEYPASEAAFRAILDASPDCVMARWGIAMSLWHPLWAPPSQAELLAGASVLEGAVEAADTSREAGYLAAIRSFYDSHESTPHARRAETYRDRMEALYREHLDDPEATVFYALSLLGAADPKDKTYGAQFRAAGMLNWCETTSPTTPVFSTT